MDENSGHNVLDNDSDSGISSGQSVHNQYMSDNAYNNVIHWLNNSSKQLINPEIVEINEEMSLDCISHPGSDFGQMGCPSMDIENSEQMEKAIEQELSQLDPKEYNIPTEAVVKLQSVLRRNVLGMSLSEFKYVYHRLHSEKLEDQKWTKPCLSELFFKNHKIFSIEEIKDPKTDERLSSVDCFAFPYLIHDSTVRQFKYTSKTIARKPEYQLKQSIPDYLRIHYFKRIRSSDSMDLRQLTEDSESLGFQSDFQSDDDVFERLQEVLPIEKDGNQRVRLKSVPEIQQFVSDLAEEQQFSVIHKMFELNIGCVSPGLHIHCLDIREVFNQFKGKIVSIQLSYVLNPKSFFGQILDKEFKYTKDFDHFCRQLNKYYNKNKNFKSISVLKELIVKGFNCVTYCPKYEWIRVEVTETPNFDELDVIKVKSIDFGHKLKVKAEDLKFLLSDFIELPKLSVPFRLYGVQKAEEKDGKDGKGAKKMKKWKKKFREFVFKHREREETNGENYCQFISFDGNCIELNVFETDDLNQYYSINQQLVELGFAQNTGCYVEPDWHQLYERVQKRYCSQTS